MCVQDDSRPPIAPMSGAAIDGEETILEAGDGNRLRAFTARAVDPTGAGMLVLPDVRGLHPFYEELALRFAERGIESVAIDYFGRTAPDQPRGEGFEHQPHVQQVTFDGLTNDARAGATELRRRGARSIFAVGFCMGGRLAFDLAADQEAIPAGVIGFYGWPVGERHHSPAPAEIADRFYSPVLAIFGGADPGIPPEHIEEFRAALERAGVEHEIVTYDGAPHSFFDRKAEQHRRDSEEAWAKVLEFVFTHTASPS